MIFPALRFLSCESQKPYFLKKKVVLYIYVFFGCLVFPFRGFLVFFFALLGDCGFTQGHHRRHGRAVGDLHR